jgi:hypothetical protein
VTAGVRRVQRRQALIETTACRGLTLYAEAGALTAGKVERRAAAAVSIGICRTCCKRRWSITATPLKLVAWRVLMEGPRVAANVAGRTGAVGGMRPPQSLVSSPLQRAGG